MVLPPELKCPVQGCTRIRVKHGGPKRNKRSKYCFIHNLYIFKRCEFCKDFLNKQGRRWCDKCRAYRKKQYYKSERHKKTKRKWYLLNREKVLRKLKLRRQNERNKI